MLLLTINSPIQASPCYTIKDTLIQVTSSETTTPQAYTYEWRYKTINGALHKRLYNLSTNEWVGDWIPC